eukprot:SAG11_NODE_18609_length_486_cov_0.664083_1_plen_60_part_10
MLASPSSRRPPRAQWREVQLLASLVGSPAKLKVAFPIAFVEMILEDGYHWQSDATATKF